MISDTSKFEKPNENQTLKLEALLERFLRKLKQKYFSTKMKIINCILLFLLLLVSILPKYTGFSLESHFLNFAQ